MALPRAALALSAAALALALAAAPGAGAERIEVVTERGNVFVMEDAAGAGAGPGPAEAGPGAPAGLVYMGGGGMLVRAGPGTVESLRPYSAVDAADGLVTAVFPGDRSVQAAIPELAGEYRYAGGSLSMVPARDPPSILGYLDQRTVSGDIRVSGWSAEGLRIEGAGRLVVKLNDLGDSRLVVSGELPSGATARLVESPYDLTSIEHEEGPGFLILYCTCNPEEGNTRITSGSVADSVKSGRFEYDQRAYTIQYYGAYRPDGYGQFPVRGVVHQVVDAGVNVAPGRDGYTMIVGDSAEPELMDPRDLIRPGARLHEVTYNRVDNYQLWVYDTLPAKLLAALPAGEFSSEVAFTPGPKYLVVDSAGGRALVSGAAPAGPERLEVSGLPPGAAYVVSAGGGTLAAGSTGPDGRISLGAFGSSPLPGAGARLAVYDRSPSHEAVGGAGMMVFDRASSRAFVAPAGPNGTAYVAHAYADVPLPAGGANVTGVSLGGEAPLAYLDGVYPPGGRLLVPIVPIYGDIRMEVDGELVVLRAADVVGGAASREYGPASSTIDASRRGGHISSVSSAAGAVAYVAASGGGATASFSAVVSGETSVTNAVEYSGPPPESAAPSPAAPLSVWAEAYVNGVPAEAGGLARAPVPLSAEPAAGHRAWADGKVLRHLAAFEYEPSGVSGSLSVPAEDGDVVEFYLYVEADARGGSPPEPAGLGVVSRGSAASATAALESATVAVS